MAVLLLLALCLGVLAGCSASRPAAPSTAAGSLGLPRHAELDALVPPRTVSATPAHPLRLCMLHGFDIMSAPQASRNAVLNDPVDSLNLRLSGTLQEFPFSIYAVDPVVLSSARAWEAIRFEAHWDTAPTGEQGLYVGFSNHATDRWDFVLIDQLDSWTDLSALSPQGRDSGPSYVALINYSESELVVDNVFLRMNNEQLAEGDEAIYCSHQSVGPDTRMSIKRIGLQSPLEVDTVHEGDSTAAYVKPYLIPQADATRLVYTRLDIAATHSEVWLSELDGSGAAVFGSFPGLNALSAGSSPDGDTLWLQENASVPFSLWAATVGPPLEYGPLGRETDLVLEAIWDISSPAEWAAIGALHSPQRMLARFEQDGPLTTGVAPEALYTPLPTEEAQRPAFLTMYAHDGDLIHWIMFDSRNRDDSSINAYFYRPEYFPDVVAPYEVDSAIDFVRPTPSPDGTQLAFILSPGGLSSHGDLYVAPLFGHDVEPRLLHDRVMVEGSLAWHDPLP